MEALNKLAANIQALEHKVLKQYIMAFLCLVLGISGLFIYYIHQKESDLIASIQQLQKLSNNAMSIIESNKNMDKEEQRLKDLLDKNKDFTIKSFFEQFCREQNIIPEAGWDTRTESLNDKFEEIILPAIFKGQNTQKIVTILEALNKKELVYLKECDIRSEGPGTLTLSITIAIKKYKSLLD